VYPGFDVDPGVALVAIGAAKSDRYLRILGHGKDEQLLLQVRAMIFGAAIGDYRGGSPADQTA
jgi:hypothetical protein